MMQFLQQNPALATFVSQGNQRYPSTPNSSFGEAMWLGLIELDGSGQSRAQASGINMAAFDQVYSAGGSASDAFAAAITPTAGLPLPSKDLLGRAFASTHPLQEEYEAGAARYVADLNNGGSILPKSIKDFNVFWLRSVGLSVDDAVRIGSGDTSANLTDGSGMPKAANKSYKFAKASPMPPMSKADPNLKKLKKKGSPSTYAAVPHDVNVQAGSLDIGLVVAGLALLGAGAYAAGWLKF